jgi:hypothetical protein
MGGWRGICHEMSKYDWSVNAPPVAVQLESEQNKMNLCTEVICCEMMDSNL